METLAVLGTSPVEILLKLFHLWENSNNPWFPAKKIEAKDIK